MTTPMSEAVVGIDDSVNVLRRRWRLIAVFTVAGLCLGLLTLLTRNEAYTSDALVEVRPLVSQGDSPNLDVTRQVNTTTEQSIASSQRVIERAMALIQAADELGVATFDGPDVEALASTITIDGEDARRVQEQIEVTVEDRSEVLRIEATAGRATRAQALAQAVANAYLDFRANAATAATTGARERLIAREAELLTELDEIAAGIEVLEQQLVDEAVLIDPENPGLGYEPQVRPAELMALELAEVSKRQNLSGIGTRLANIDAIQINVGDVLDDADLPAQTSGVPPIVGPLAGILVGLGLGVAAAFARDRADSTVRDPLHDLPNAGTAILGFSPAENRIAVTEGSAPRVDDAYRRTQAVLLHQMDGRDQQVVLVTGTSSIGDSGAAAVAAANLAVAAARVGRKTLLVLSDLRNPSLHERFDLGDAAGMAEVITGKVSLGEVSHRTPELANLFVVPPGLDLSNPERILQSPNMGRLLEKARSSYDLIVLDTPALTDYADAVVIGPLCDTSVLVVEPNVTRRADLDSALRQIQAIGLHVSGAIVADPISKQPRR